MSPRILRTFGETMSVWRSARDSLAMETPARRATSAIRERIDAIAL